MQGCFNICKSVQVIQHITGIRDKNHITLSKDLVKTFDKFQHPFILEATRNRRIIYLYILKIIYGKPVAHIILNWET
jgi:hypothetical protein